jgi:hypothetical protein
VTPVFWRYSFPRYHSAFTAVPLALLAGADRPLDVAARAVPPDVDEGTFDRLTDADVICCDRAAVGALHRTSKRKPVVGHVHIVETAELFDQVNTDYRKPLTHTGDENTRVL